MIKTFPDVDIERCVDAGAHWWPDRGAASGDSLGGNREYCDLRHLSWHDAQEVLIRESALVSKCEALEAIPDHYQEDCEDEIDEFDFDLLRVTDIGVAGVVAALAAARCIPCSSCNGGALGGWHHEECPVVAFYARPQHVPLLLKAAEMADVGLVNSAEGCLAVYSADIRRMLEFTRSMLTLSKDFRQLRFTTHKDTL